MKFLDDFIGYSRAGAAIKSVNTKPSDFQEVIRFLLLAKIQLAVFYKSIGKNYWDFELNYTIDKWFKKVSRNSFISYPDSGGLNLIK